MLTTIGQLDLLISDGRCVFKRIISRDGGCPWGTSGQSSATWLAVPVQPVPIDSLVATQNGVYFHALLTPGTAVGGDPFPHVIVWEGENYLEDGHHRVVRAMLDGLREVEARVLVLDGVLSRTMTMGRRKRHNGEEEDAFSRYWRSLIPWQRGELRKIKRGANKRARRAGRREAQSED